LIDTDFRNRCLVDRGKYIQSYSRLMAAQTTLWCLHSILVDWAELVDQVQLTPRVQARFPRMDWMGPKLCQARKLELILFLLHINTPKLSIIVCIQDLIDLYSSTRTFLAWCTYALVTNKFTTNFAMASTVCGVEHKNEPLHWAHQVLQRSSWALKKHGPYWSGWRKLLHPGIVFAWFTRNFRTKFSFTPMYVYRSLFVVEREDQTLVTSRILQL
jgi:hypothetical protein